MLKRGSYIKNSLLFITLICIFCTSQIHSQSQTEIKKCLLENSKSHPRLFFSESEELLLLKKIQNNPHLTNIYDSIIESVEKIYREKPVERKVYGRRLLGVSRTCLNRITRLSLVYRLTKDQKCLDRAKEELLAAANFEDWNPSHFLDVGEMTAALAIGYDWLYHDLSEASRKKIRDAIIDKGLKAGEGDDLFWVSKTHNWNPVCHGGLILGALAVMEDEPGLAAQIIERALINLPLAIEEYAPDGGYQEGPGYWSYGTSFTILLIDALQSALGTDFGLSEIQGFLKTPYYYLHTTGPTGLYYNYSDCGSRGSLSPSMFWFADQLKDPSLLFWEMKKFDHISQNSRLLPFLFIWSPEFDTIPKSETTHWMARGTTPIALLRSDWTEDAIYVGIKGGSPFTNHAHMDVGSFVIDAGGQRWAWDLGSQNYHSLEKIGLDLWTMTQESERWDVFRLNNFSHNTLVVNDNRQLVNEFSKIIEFSSKDEMPFAIVDMTPVYKNDLAKAHRGMALLSNEIIIVQDELKANATKANIRWAMLTQAKIKTKGSKAILKQNKQKMNFYVLQPSDVELKIYQSDPPPADYDSRNKGTRMLGFEIGLAPDTEQSITILMSQNDLNQTFLPVYPLAEWK